MPYCPKCATPLTKRTSTKEYVCKKHGFVRKINTPTLTYLNKDKENVS